MTEGSVARARRLARGRSSSCGRRRIGRCRRRRRGRRCRRWTRSGRRRAAASAGGGWFAGRGRCRRGGCWAGCGWFAATGRAAAPGRGRRRRCCGRRHRRRPCAAASTARACRCAPARTGPARDGGRARTREAKIVAFRSVNGETTRRSAAIDSAATRDTDPEPSAFGARLEREARRAGFAAARVRWCWATARSGSRRWAGPCTGPRRRSARPCAGASSAGRTPS